MHDLRVNGGRLWDSLMEMATLGATAKGGSCRLALSDADREGRDLFVSWCRAAGCAVSVDRMGNVFARRRGSDDGLPPWWRAAISTPSRTAAGSTACSASSPASR